MTTPDYSDPRDYVLELSSVSVPSSPAPSPAEKSTTSASFLSIHFRCCNTYARIYKNAAGTAYSGHCPKCQRRAQIGISADGSKSRMFEAF
jgi:hypothetical protein